MNRRTEIRNAIFEALEASNISIKNIQMNRPTPLMLSDVPVVCIYSGDESTDLMSGSTYIPQLYKRIYTIKIDIITSDMDRADDFLDTVSSQVEFAMFKDLFYGKSWIHGTSLEDSKPYITSDTADKVFYATSLTFNIAYEADAIVDTKFKTLESYKLDLIDSENILISADQNL